MSARSSLVKIIAFSFGENQVKSGYLNVSVQAVKVLCFVILHTSSPMKRGIIVLKNVFFFWIMTHNYGP
jgi:hypothetical protein